MVFSSTIFLFLFLPAVLLAYFVAPKSAKNTILLVASLFFYAWGEIYYVFVMLASIIMNYIVGIGIDSCSSKSKQKIVLAVGVTLNLLLLGTYKYANFLIGTVNYWLELVNINPVAMLPIHLPIGISFFTFQAISYIVDIYRGDAKVQRNPFNLALYISLFPQLIAGPIVRYNMVDEQIRDRTSTIPDIADGIRRFIIGLGKKTLLANPLGQVADAAFALPTADLTTNAAWMGVICYSLQIFFDFSGYSDMAIGLGKVFGFTFPENFNYPYISKSVREFWRRWHISLSSWLRDYLYIPLGGSRRSPARNYFNLVIVFLLCGLWHGASWTFVVWGIFHGIFLVLERTKVGEFISKLPSPVQHFYLLLFITVSWVFFRSDTITYAFGYIEQMFALNFGGGMNSEVARYVDNFTITGFVFGILLSSPGFLHLKKKKIVDGVDVIKKEPKLWVLALKDIRCVLILFASIVQIAASTYNPFIYFRF